MDWRVSLWVTNILFKNADTQSKRQGFFLLFLLFPFYGPTCGVWKVPDQGSHESCSCWPVPQPQQHQTWATSVTDTTACGLARSFVHWARPGFEPPSSWQQCQVLSLLSHEENSKRKGSNESIYLRVAGKRTSVLLNGRVRLCSGQQGRYRPSGGLGHWDSIIMAVTRWGPSWAIRPHRPLRSWR